MSKTTFLKLFGKAQCTAYKLKVNCMTKEHPYEIWMYTCRVYVSIQIHSNNWWLSNSLDEVTSIACYTKSMYTASWGHLLISQCSLSICMTYWLVHVDSDGNNRYGTAMFVIVAGECHESEEQNTVIWSKRVGKYQYHYGAVYAPGTLVIADWEVVECTRGVNNAADYGWFSPAVA